MNALTSKALGSSKEISGDPNSKFTTTLVDIEDLLQLNKSVLSSVSDRSSSSSLQENDLNSFLQAWKYHSSAFHESKLNLPIIDLRNSKSKRRNERHSETPIVIDIDSDKDENEEDESHGQKKREKEDTHVNKKKVEVLDDEKSDEWRHKIRSRLILWYRENRRKLPWRGDLPPYGKNNNTNHNCNRREENKYTQVEKKNQSKGNSRSKKLLEQTTIGYRKKRDLPSSSSTLNQSSLNFSLTSAKGKTKNDSLQTKSKISCVDSVHKSDILSTTTREEEEENENKNGNYSQETKILSSSSELFSQEVKISPYGTWVSEVMLQQTRVETVIDYYNRWMKAFPTVEALSEATEVEINSLWAGLGYYRRARMLHEGSKYIMKETQGKLPSEVADLLKVPGIGAYTAGAISSIAFNNPSALVDGNVLRVFSRLFAYACSPKDSSFVKKSWDIANYIMDGCDSPSDFNQGLMELGATVCTTKSPSCGICPLQEVCYTKSLSSYYLDLTTIGNHALLLSSNHKKKEKKNVGLEFLTRGKGEKGGEGEDELLIKQNVKDYPHVISIDTEEDNSDYRTISTNPGDTSMISLASKTNKSSKKRKICNDSVIKRGDQKKKEKEKELQLVENSSENDFHCDICQGKGITKILELFETTRDSTHNKASSCDLSKTFVEAFPLKAEKKEPKTEFLYVALVELPIRRSKKNSHKEFDGQEKNADEFEDDSWFLMRKRPKSGLLANQWEFPWIDIRSDFDTNNKKGDEDNYSTSITTIAATRATATAAALTKEKEREQGKEKKRQNKQRVSNKRNHEAISSTTTTTTTITNTTRKLNSTSSPSFTTPSGNEPSSDSLRAELFTLLLSDINLTQVFQDQSNIQCKKDNANCRTNCGNNEYIEKITDIGDLTHVFSHVKHNMKIVWIQLKPLHINQKTFNQKEFKNRVKNLKFDLGNIPVSPSKANNSSIIPSSWKSLESKQEIAWLNNSLFKKEGISTGMVKILEAVDERREKKSG